MEVQQIVVNLGKKVIDTANLNLIVLTPQYRRYYEYLDKYIERVKNGALDNLSPIDRDFFCNEFIKELEKANSYFLRGGSALKENYIKQDSYTNEENSKLTSKVA